MDHSNNHSEMPSDLEDHPLMQEDLDDVQDELEDSSATSAPSDEALSRENEVLRTRNEQLMRIAADFENYKRRLEREREEHAKFAGQQIITGLLPVLDNFERAVQAETSAHPEEGGTGSFLEGIRMIHRQFLDVMTKAGVTPLDAMGEPFNPEFHEAIMSEENPDVPDETVIAEFQRGYVMHGRLLRPSVVKVSKA